MPLTSIPELMHQARQQGYALGYFESWNLESLQGVLDAAEQTRSPIIIGFNGEFLSHEGRVVKERLELYGALGKAAAEAASVPCGLIFNECTSDAWVRRAVQTGFNLVMPIPTSSESTEAYARRTRSVVQYAHAHQVAVEAELGSLPHGSEASSGEATDPQQAARFVEETGVDLLAVSVGNIHVSLKGTHDLNLERLAAIHKATEVPLVLHGGTGISAGSLREAIKLGVRKVNYGTYLKQRYLAALSKGLVQSIADPHRLLGMGGDQDLLVQGRWAVRDAVLERIELLGCVGKG